MPKCILLEQNDKTQSLELSLRSIAITTPPTKTKYRTGEVFDSSGMVITASYGTEEHTLATAAITTYTIENADTPLEESTTQIKISYQELGKSYSVSQPITVYAQPYIHILINPSKTEYEYGDSFDPSGWNIELYRPENDGYSDVTDDITYSPTIFKEDINPGYSYITPSIAITYESEEYGTLTTTLENVIKVYRKQISYPTFNGNLTYNDATQKVDPTNWTNYDETSMYYVESDEETTLSAMNAGTYYVKFWPKKNYCWSTTKSTSFYKAPWIISKTSRNLTANPTFITLNNDNYSSGVTINLEYNGDTGTINYSYTGSNMSFTADDNNKTLTIKPTAKTSQEFTITIAIGETNNYLSGSTMVSTTCSFWEWGEDGSIADAAWFEGLKEYLKNNTGKDDWVGKTKVVQWDQTFYGINELTFRVIGVNQDSDNTVTWMATSCLTQSYLNSKTTSFEYNDSHIYNILEGQTDGFNSYFPGDSAVKSYNRGIVLPGKSEPTYYPMRYFIPSRLELGLPNSANSGECVEGKEDYSYLYFNVNDKRIITDNNNYWTRSFVNRNTSSYQSYIIDGSDGTCNNFVDSIANDNDILPAFTIGN